MEPVTAAVKGALIAGAITILAVRRGVLPQGKRLAIEYAHTLMPLIGHAQGVGSLATWRVDTVSSRENEQEPEDFRPVESAYGFVAQIANTGNAVVARPFIEIAVDRSAQIVDFETEPRSSQGNSIDLGIDPDAGYRLCGHVEFINPGTALRVKLISIDNLGDSCDVSVVSPSLSVREANIDKSIRFIMLGLVLAMVPLLVWGAIGVLAQHVLSDEVASTLGYEIRVESLRTTPLWWRLVVWGMLPLAMWGSLAGFWPFAPGGIFRLRKSARGLRWRGADDS